MNQQPRWWDRNIEEQRRDQSHQEMANVENAYYDGDAGYSEYSRAISDLLKDPVSLGTVAGNSHRGHPH